MKIRHYFADFTGLGGVNRLMREHHARDRDRLGDSEFVIYNERKTRAVDRVHFLGLQGWHSIRRARDEVRRIVSENRAEASIFHGLWGWENLADLETAPLHLLLLHGEVPGLEGCLRQRPGSIHGIGCVSEPLHQLAGDCFPELLPERIARIPYPVEPLSGRPAGRETLASPLTIGICGRVTREQKRADRLPALWTKLAEHEPGVRLEILGDGSELEGLRTRFSDIPAVHFHGRLDGEDYWEVVARWDAILFISEYEGLPIALLEALSCGVIPIFPRIGCGGDAYTESIDPRLVYPAGDLDEAVSRLSLLGQLPAPEIANLRDRCRSQASHHTYPAYFSAIESLLEAATAHGPGEGASGRPVRRSRLLDACPIKALERTVRLRHRLGIGARSASEAGTRDSLTGTFLR